MDIKKCILLLFLFSALFIDRSHSQPNTYSDLECLFCHGKSNIFQITSDGAVRSVYVDPEEWSQDIHQRSKMVCVDCHTNANPYVHFREGFIDVDCARCHPEEEEEYQKNIHLTFTTITSGKELPSCHHCHSRHYVLPQDNSSSSVHESNVGKTCAECHAEVMMTGLLKGASLGKISGHRKGDLAQRFDMKVCIDCHYEDAAHGAKRIYKDYCSRCHDVRSKINIALGPTHINSVKWKRLNHVSSGLTLFLLMGMCTFVAYKSRRKISSGLRAWCYRMKSEAPTAKEKNQDNDDKE
jgi:hypothetical protein